MMCKDNEVLRGFNYGFITKKPLQMERLIGLINCISD